MEERENLDELAEQINEEYRRLQDAPTDKAAMLRVGELLRTAKVSCAEDAWTAWLSEKFEGSGKTADDLLTLYALERAMYEALAFMRDDRNLTPEGIVAREALLGDLEAIAQEHRPR